MYHFEFTLCKLLTPVSVEKADTINFAASSQYEALEIIRKRITDRREAGLTVMSCRYYNYRIKKMLPVFLPLLQENLFFFFGN
jgi:hypothetical protein